MNERSIDATLTAAAGLFGALLLAAAGLRLFAPAVPISMTAPVSPLVEAARVGHRHSPRTIHPPRSIRAQLEMQRPRFATMNTPTRPLAVNVHPGFVAEVYARPLRLHPRPRYVSTGTSPHVASRPRAQTKATVPIACTHDCKPEGRPFTALPMAPIGYDPHPALAAPDVEARPTSAVPETLPTYNPQHRRRWWRTSH